MPNIPVPVAGSTFYDPKTGQPAGTNQFDPNTGKALNPVQSSPSSSSSSDFMSAIQSKLLQQSGVISSTNSDLQAKLEAAISGVQTSADKANQATASAYDRQIADASQAGQDSMINGRAGGAGGVLNIAALRELTNTTDKNLKDLEQRKQELILQNDSAAASKIADLQFKALEFQQQANQQVFSNLLGLGDFGLKQQTAELAQKSQSFQESQAISTIALKYGLQVQPGDTLASITSKAMPYASAEEKLQLQKAAADINNANAQAAKYMADAKTAKGGLDALTASVLAGNYVKSDPAMQAYILQGIKTPTDMAAFQGALSQANTLKNNSINESIPALATKSINEIQNLLSSSDNSYSQQDVANILAKVKQYQIENPDVIKSGNDSSFFSSSFVKNFLPAVYKTPTTGKTAVRVTNPDGTSKIIYK